MPENTIYVGRPSAWGNPFDARSAGRVSAVVRFACEVAPLLDVAPLRGKNLACWCRIGEECHADVLLKLANDPGWAEPDDIEFARKIHEKTIPYYSKDWPRIGELQRAGLVKVIVHNRWVAETRAIGEAAP